MPSAAVARSSAWLFLKAFVRAPRRIGAVVPTSRGLGRRMARLAGIDSAQLAAELGAGTGVVTRELLRALPADARLWAFEIHPPFVEHLRATIIDRRFAVVAQSAAAIADFVEREHLPAFDVIVSALPFSLMAPEQTATILRAAGRVLRPDGRFVALQYHPRYLAPLLRAEFAAVDREVYPWNIPPAVVLRARGPRRAG